jgi:hypothetical protein
MTPDGTVYSVRDDMSWRARRHGINLPVAAEILGIIYDRFSDFPAAPGEKRLADLAKRTNGRVAWRNLYPTRPGTIV